MSQQDTVTPKRRSSAGTKRRRSQVKTNSQVQKQTGESTEVESSATTSTDTTVARPRHEQRREDRRKAKETQPEKAKGVQRIVNTKRFSGVMGFVEDVRNESRKVEWPDAETTRNLTLLVIGLSVFLGALLGGIDYVLFQVFEKLI